MSRSKAEGKRSMSMEARKALQKMKEEAKRFVRTVAAASASAARPKTTKATKKGK